MLVIEFQLLAAFPDPVVRVMYTPRAGITSAVGAKVQRWNGLLRADAVSRTISPAKVDKAAPASAPRCRRSPEATSCRISLDETASRATNALEQAHLEPQRAPKFFKRRRIAGLLVSETKIVADDHDSRAQLPSRRNRVDELLRSELGAISAVNGSTTMCSIPCSRISAHAFLDRGQQARRAIRRHHAASDADRTSSTAGLQTVLTAASRSARPQQAAMSPA